MSFDNDVKQEIKSNLEIFQKFAFAVKARLDIKYYKGMNAQIATLRTLLYNLDDLTKAGRDKAIVKHYQTVILHIHHKLAKFIKEKWQNLVDGDSALIDKIQKFESE